MSIIAAIATAPGRGGIGIVRMSGPDSRNLLRRVFLPHSAKFENFRPWMLHHGKALDCNGEALDDVLAVFMPGPKTFTGEDMAEIQCHGGPLIVRMILESLLRAGARQARRGEFTRRAFVNGRMDLSQAEAVAELIAAPSREALRYGLNRLEGNLAKKIASLREKLDDARSLACIGLDFPDDEISVLPLDGFAARVRELLCGIDELLRASQRARMMQNGGLVALAGAVNAGKSSLLNILSGSNRALVTDIPGTTRDFLEAHVNLDGLPVCLVDTAGLRDSSAEIDPVEALGMEQSRDLLEKADLAVLVVDGSHADAASGPNQAACEIMAIRGGKPMLLVWNKCDLRRPETFPPAWAATLPGCMVSAVTGENVEQLARMIRELLLGGDKALAPDDGLAPNMRQAMALEQAADELKMLLQDIGKGMPHDCCLTRLDFAAAALEDIMGKAGHDELLDIIFSRFCIGK